MLEPEALCVNIDQVENFQFRRQQHITECANRDTSYGRFRTL